MALESKRSMSQQTAELYDERFLAEFDEVD